MRARLLPLFALALLGVPLAAASAESLQDNTKEAERLANEALTNMMRALDLLIMTELISAADGKDLLELNKYRNLVFHGHVDEAERAMIEKTIAARTRITSALRQYT